MFGKFLRWLAPQDKTLLALAADDLLAFLEQAHPDGRKVLNSVIRAQYLGLLERVYAHLAIEPNPARHACFALYRSALGKNQDKAILTAAQEAAFMAALPGDHDEEEGTGNWKRWRDRAMQAMMLGAGLKVAEVTGIYSDNVGDKDTTGSIPLTISPASAGGPCARTRRNCDRLRCRKSNAGVGYAPRSALRARSSFLPLCKEASSLARPSIVKSKRHSRAPAMMPRIWAGAPCAMPLPCAN